MKDWTDLLTEASAKAEAFSLHYILNNCSAEEIKEIFKKQLDLFYTIMNREEYGLRTCLNMWSDERELFLIFEDSALNLDFNFLELCRGNPVPSFENSKIILVNTFNITKEKFKKCPYLHEILKIFFPNYTIDFTDSKLKKECIK